MTEVLSRILMGAIVGDAAGLRARLLAIQEGSRGVIVLNVKAASLAATAGLKPGDIIEEVNNKPIDNVADLKNAIEYSAWPLRLLVNRYHRSVFILLPKEMLCTAESR